MDYDTEDTIETKPAYHYVAIYLVDLAYGGPEEGGWYYSCGQLVTDSLNDVPTEYMFKLFDKNSEKDRYEWRKKVQDHLDKTVNVGRREISSVLSTGRYQALCFNGLSAKSHFPDVIPHYE